MKLLGELFPFRSTVRKLTPEYRPKREKPAETQGPARFSPGTSERFPYTVDISTTV